MKAKSLFLELVQRIEATRPNLLRHDLGDRGD
jgi:hypothetical protein